MLRFIFRRCCCRAYLRHVADDTILCRLLPCRIIAYATCFAISLRCLRAARRDVTRIYAYFHAAMSAMTGCFRISRRAMPAAIAAAYYFAMSCEPPRHATLMPFRYIFRRHAAFAAYGSHCLMPITPSLFTPLIFADCHIAPLRYYATLRLLSDAMPPCRDAAFRALPP